MSHLNEVIARVDAAIDESVIAHMNELLIELSDDAELSREERLYPQRLRTAISHHGKQHKEEMEARRAAHQRRRYSVMFKTGVGPATHPPPASLHRTPGRSAPAAGCHGF